MVFLCLCWCWQWKIQQLFCASFSIRILSTVAKLSAHVGCCQVRCLERSSLRQLDASHDITWLYHTSLLRVFGVQIRLESCLIAAQYHCCFPCFLSRLFHREQDQDCACHSLRQLAKCIRWTHHVEHNWILGLWFAFPTALTMSNNTVILCAAHLFVQDSCQWLIHWRWVGSLVQPSGTFTHVHWSISCSSMSWMWYLVRNCFAHQSAV